MKFMREIGDAQMFSARVTKLLRETAEQQPLVADAVWEEVIRADGRMQVHCPVRMPPPMQAIHLERAQLYEELAFERPRRPDLIQVRIVTLQIYLADWYTGELLVRPAVVRHLYGKEYFLGVGGSWRMIVVEKLPLHLES